MTDVTAQNKIVKSLTSKVDVNTLMDVHVQIKQELIEQGKVNNVSEIWAQSGKYLLQQDNSEMAEVCYFMANLYDKNNISHIDGLIDCYIQNEKYRFAIDFLSHLFIAADQTDRTLFWNRIVDILPVDQLLMTITKFETRPLEVFIQNLDLDIEDPMTWMCIGYTLKANDLLILATQAIDNAIALKYFS